ncbi:big defensin-like [Mercenaria mercenaria]|uniref:big defensin-like n=1 Tax=Mercenaria mercenaria TaxID=6596 RepID=UPI00234FB4F9|nr:big defensin-like [Mercenaria mercenaria]
MKRTAIYCIVYITLLTVTTPAICLLTESADEQHENQKRYAVAALPLYAGVAVSPWVWAALIAAYGVAALYEYSVSRTSSDSHSCANNRGWCRDPCQSHEYIDHYNTPVCGNLTCCRTRI